MKQSVFFMMCALALGASAVSVSNAQLATADTNTGGVTAQNLVDALLGADSDAIVSNISVTGDARCLGLFSGGNSVTLGIDSGVALSSGRLNDAVGPNFSDGTTTNYNSPGDAFLDTLQPFATEDACVLEFDFECENIDVVSFQYVFGSEEYNEFVGTSFNDSFGFELCPGAGGGCLNNIALVPCNPVVPVVINNVNCGNPFGSNLTPCPNVPFCDQFINNDPSDGGPFFNYEMDGITQLFGAQANIAPGVNHMKLAIADAGDSSLDSWVFLEAGSFQCGGLCDPDPRSQGYWHHECLVIPESDGGIDPGRNGHGPSEPNEEDFASLMDCAAQKLEDIGFFGMTTCEGMNADPPNDMCEKATKQLTALILNVCSDKLQNTCGVELEGCGSETVGDLIQELADLIHAENCSQANECADLVNTGEAIPTESSASHDELIIPFTTSQGAIKEVSKKAVQRVVPSSPDVQRETRPDVRGGNDEERKTRKTTKRNSSPRR